MNPHAERLHREKLPSFSLRTRSTHETISSLPDEIQCNFEPLRHHRTESNVPSLSISKGSGFKSQPAHHDQHK